VRIFKKYVHVTFVDVFSINGFLPKLSRNVMALSLNLFSPPCDEIERILRSYNML
jgi:hypothetical protein